ncbi:MAG: hypothetical protein QNJ65_18840 [Xenococcaceae cyanobacterium MO_234.B1]|nr:hypothetical protein [Xenococcaceae cyanobacterium MO_234.B1]
MVNQSQLDVNVVAQLLKPPSEEREAAPQNSVRFGTLHTTPFPRVINVALSQYMPEDKNNGGYRMGKRIL